MNVRAAVTDKPVWRDGYTSTLTYLVVATKASAPSYNMICYGRGKVKFYPHPEFFGLQEEEIVKLGGDQKLIRRNCGYTRYVFPRENMEALLDLVRNKRGMVVCPAGEFESAYTKTNPAYQGAQEESRFKLPAGAGPELLHELPFDASLVDKEVEVGPVETHIDTPFPKSPMPDPKADAPKNGTGTGFHHQ